MTDIFSKEYLIEMYNKYEDDFEAYIIIDQGGHADMYGNGKYNTDINGFEIKDKIDRSVEIHFKG